MPRISIKISLGLFLLCLTQGAYADNRPAGYARICSSDESCTLHTTTNVAFGRNNQFTYRVLSGTFVCSAATFGVSLQAGEVNECSIPSRLLRSTPGQRRPSASNYGGSQTPASDSST